MKDVERKVKKSSRGIEKKMYEYNRKKTYIAGSNFTIKL
jgi:hypothetical protein